MDGLYNTALSNQFSNHERLSDIHIPNNESPFPLLGNSDAINKIKRQLIYASQINIPIFISGETGTEKRTLAHYIHQNRPNADGQFIYVSSETSHLDDYKQYLDVSISNAVDGMLFLAEIDKLNDQHKDYLTYLFSNEEIYRQLTQNNVQLVVSCTQTLTNNHQFLSKILGSSAPHLELHIPPLSERQEDISVYIDHFLTLFGLSKPPKISPQARDLLCQFNWPGNVAQLQKVMMTLVSSHPYRITDKDVSSLGITTKSSVKQDLIGCLLSEELETYQNTHPALYKSLVYISSHYRDELSLQSVADASFTSPSHLSFLFRQYLNNSFKSILVQLRVRYAKTILDDNPMAKITDVCLQSGFGDLSHFEKMFKRHEKCTPRQYRQQQREAYKEALLD